MKKHLEKKSRRTGSPIKEIMLTLPLLGSWFYFSLRRNSGRNIFIMNALLLLYFTASNLFLNGLIWIVPYFLEAALKVAIKINHFLITLGYLLLLLSTLCDRFDAWVKSKQWFQKIKKYLEPSSKLTH